VVVGLAANRSAVVSTVPVLRINVKMRALQVDSLVECSLQLAMEELQVRKIRWYVKSNRPIAHKVMIRYNIRTIREARTPGVAKYTQVYGNVLARRRQSQVTTSSSSYLTQQHWASINPL
jgi:hypothetical protein